MFGSGRWAHIIFKLLYLDTNNYVEVRESQGKFASKSKKNQGIFVRTCEWEPCLKALNGISMESAQGLFLDYGTTLKCHFYDLIVFT